MTILLVLTYLVALPVLVYSINALNLMSRATPHGIRIGYMLVALGAMAAVLGPLFDKPESWTSFAILFGCCVLFFSDRRQPFHGVPHVQLLRKH